MDTQRFYLSNRLARHNAAKAVTDAPDGMVCEIKPWTQHIGQKTKLASMFKDIAAQVEFGDREHAPEIAKRLLLDRFARVKAADGEILPGYGSDLPSLIGNGFVHLGLEPCSFTEAQLDEFITFLYAWGVDHGVRFTDSCAAPEWYRDRQNT